MSSKPIPDWSKWRQIPDFHLCEAVALSLDMEPADVRDTSSYPFHSDGLTATPEFIRRATILERIVESGNPERSGLILQRREAASLACTIAPSDFVRWAQANDWSLPTKLTDLAAKRMASTKLQAGRWPWGDYETALLCHLEAAARKWWANYDPNDPTTAPTVNEVAQWLQSEHGLTQNKAEAIATILRADDLPKGPRR